MKALLATGVILVALVTPAFANQCPSLIKKAEEMAKAMSGDQATMTKFAEKIALAKSEHEAGNHDASVAATKEAMKLLGM